MKPYRPYIGMLLSFMLCSGLHAASPATSVPFGPESFQTFVDQKQSSILVFSARYCAHCPAVVRSLAKQRGQLPNPPQLVVVMIDELPTATEKKSSYSDVDRLMVFQGNEMAIRFSVNPSWRGLTPFVTLINKAGEVTYFNGEPPARALRAWLDREAR
ncbi:MAG: hypothetical protein EBV16_06890 [Betaproteobacteria bacterium]|nr:hypothetical protein [Pseudomonadota bacterium]NBO03896.1 hypothetical protein [Betaproteobacteria bacterium]NDE44798.1 hypothetical protein [Betaproteobacteria bacterium]